MRRIVFALERAALLLQHIIRLIFDICVENITMLFEELSSYNVLWSVSLRECFATNSHDYACYVCSTNKRY